MGYIPELEVWVLKLKGDGVGKVYEIGVHNFLRTMLELDCDHISLFRRLNLDQDELNISFNKFRYTSLTDRIEATLLLDEAIEIIDNSDLHLTSNIYYFTSNDNKRLFPSISCVA